MKSQEKNTAELGNLENEITALLSDVEESVGRAESLQDEELLAKNKVAALEKDRKDALEAERALQEEEERIAQEEARRAEEQLAENEAARLAEEKARKDELDAERARQEDAARIAEEQERLAKEEAELAEEQLAKEMDIAAQAREAVELFEAAGRGQIESEDINGSDWKNLNFDEPTDEDLEEVSASEDFTEDFDADFDLDTVARMAREAVDQFESKLGNEEIVVERDWSLLTVVNLKKELKKRELKATGRKADLVAALEKYDRELANKAETLTQRLDSQTEVNVGLEIDARKDDESSFDIDTMTVSQLKKELRKRGLKVGGKKSELIERLASA